MKDDGHIEQFKIRLRVGDAQLVRELAKKLDVPPAVLIRRWVIAAVIAPLNTGATKCTTDKSLS